MMNEKYVRITPIVQFPKKFVIIDFTHSYQLLKMGEFQTCLKNV